MKKLSRLLVALFVAGPLLAACSNSPSTSEIKAQVTKNFAAPEIYKIVDVQKTNGQKVNDNEYFENVDVKFKFVKGIDTLKAELKKETGNNPFSMNAIQGQAVIAGLMANYGNFKAGEVKTIKRKVKFVKTEKGWKMDNSLERALEGALQ